MSQREYLELGPITMSLALLQQLPQLLAYPQNFRLPKPWHMLQHDRGRRLPKCTGAHPVTKRIHPAITDQGIKGQLATA